MYSGTWCQFPRDCTLLKQCVADEVAWAVENNKAAYEEYIADAPEIKDYSSLEECGGKRALR